MGASARFLDSLLFAKENMRRLKLWLLVALLAVGSLVSCSRASTKSPDASDSIRKSFDKSGPELGEGCEETGSETTKGKPVLSTLVYLHFGQVCLLTVCGFAMDGRHNIV
jgi:cytochrome oxidase Cu insertion factor (SCO1/SenC/PrrC family)